MRTWREGNIPTPHTVYSLSKEYESDKSPIELARITLIEKERLTNKALTPTTIGDLTKDWFKYCRSRIRKENKPALSGWEIFSWRFHEGFTRKDVFIQVLVGWE